MHRMTRTHGAEKGKKREEKKEKKRKKKRKKTCSATWRASTEWAKESALTVRPLLTRS